MFNRFDKNMPKNLLKKTTKNMLSSCFVCSHIHATERRFVALNKLVT